MRHCVWNPLRLLICLSLGFITTATVTVTCAVRGEPWVQRGAVWHWWAPFWSAYQIDVSTSTGITRVVAQTTPADRLTRLVAEANAQIATTGAWPKQDSAWPRAVEHTSNQRQLLPTPPAQRITPAVDRAQARTAVPRWAALPEAATIARREQITSLAAGWPFRAAWCVTHHDTGMPVFVPTPTERLLTIGDYDLQSVLPDGRLALVTMRRGMTDVRHIPLRPVWPGLLANTAIYAAMWWLLIAVPLIVRRELRRRHGRCEHCGYDLQDTKGPCPECGTPMTVAPEQST